METLQSTNILLPQDFLVKDDNGTDAFMWAIVPDEAKRIQSFTKLEPDKVPKGVYMTTPREKCRVCEKHMEFFDFFYTSQKRGIHSTAFMKKALEEAKPSPRLHYLTCSGCDTPFLGPASWGSCKFTWEHKEN